MELLNTVTMQEAHQKLEDICKVLNLSDEKISVLTALDRILYEDIKAPINVPEFNRSTVDGYAVIAKDTFGASDSLPSFLESIGEVEMGKTTGLVLKSGKCCYVPTGGMLPQNSDGVVMVEYTEVLEDNTVCIQAGIAPKENTLQIGEDITKGEILFKKGHRIRPQDIGVLSGIGMSEIKVYKRPRVSIISTGDEIIPPDAEAKLGQIKDMNTYSLAAAAIKDGCEIVGRDVVRDKLEELQDKLKEFIKISDIVLVSGGSSMGTKDITKDAVNGIGEPGVFIHGIAIKPGKPTIIGRINNTAVFGLPGQPVSALVVYQRLVGHLINKLYGSKSLVPYIFGELAVNIASAPGREHYVMVDILEEEGRTLIQPIYGKSGMLTMMTKSTGYIKIDTNQEGLNKGENVKVYLF